MTTTIPPPALPGPKNAPPSTGPRQSKRRSSDKKGGDSPDPVANGGLALAFLAILQSVPRTTAPTASGSAAPATAARATDTKVAAGLAGGGDLSPDGAEQSISKAQVSESIASEAQPASGSRAADGSTHTAPTLSSALPSTASGTAKPADRALVNATLKDANQSMPVEQRTDHVVSNQVQHRTVEPLPSNAQGQRQASAEGQPRSGSSGAFVQTASPRPSSAGASSAPREAAGLAAPSKMGIVGGLPVRDQMKPAAGTEVSTTGSTPASVSAAAMGSALTLPAQANTGIPPELAQTVPAQVLRQLIERPPQVGTTIVMRLDPPMLGSVVLRIVAGEGRRIRLHFEVDDPSVGDALTGGLGRLESVLRAQGLSPEGFSVGLSGGQLGSGASDQSGQGSPRSFPGQPADAPPTVAPPAPDPVHAARASGGRYIDYLL